MYLACMPLFLVLSRSAFKKGMTAAAAVPWEHACCVDQHSRVETSPCVQSTWTG